MHDAACLDIALVAFPSSSFPSNLPSLTPPLTCHPAILLAHWSSPLWFAPLEDYLRYMCDYNALAKAMIHLVCHISSRAVSHSSYHQFQQWPPSFRGALMTLRSLPQLETNAQAHLQSPTWYVSMLTHNSISVSLMCEHTVQTHLQLCRLSR